MGYGEFLSKMKAELFYVFSKMHNSYKYTF